MDKDDNKRVLDGPVTTSVRSDPPSPESIQALQERYAMFDKLTAKKPAESFESVMAGMGGRHKVADGGQPDAQSSEQDEQAQNDASASSEDASKSVAASEDTFERVTQQAERRRLPTPSGRHPDTPQAKGRGKVIIKA